ncbi:MAG: shikimate dehydrogenase [Gallionella sp.]|nr:shikimate dehydrogenase [Gallionella sp.]MDD4945659.1 shikimate dehydrogenase [Gallionella sp.]MDD5612906.1 shikimate dehydrogenase [Gallionella sp.]
MTDRYAVIGNPISHSKSPLIHRMFAVQTGQDISYEAIEAPLDGFRDTLVRLRQEGYKGCNVTVPFKFEAFNAATDLTDRALAAEAVNTLSFNDGLTGGDNTDGAGLVRDIRHNLDMALENKRVLLVGAGGAASGVVLPLLEAGAQLFIVNRTPAKACELAARFASSAVQGGGYEAIGDAQFDVVINATSAGLSGSAIPLPETLFAAGALAYDMMYGRDTPFMAFARDNGAALVADGLGMLVEQAAEAFNIWRGVRPDTAELIATLRN